MRKLHSLILALIVLSTLGCSQLQTMSNVSMGTDLLSNAEKLKNIESELRNRPEFAGKKLKFFQQINFMQIGMIQIQMENPDKPGQIDQYTYQGGAWQEPSPVQITGDGEMKDNLTPLDDIKFETVATIHKNWKEKAQTVEGAADKEPEIITFLLIVQNAERYWMASNIPGDREVYEITFNPDGSVRSYEKE